MANRYWVGGTGTWDATAGTKWSTTSGGSGGASVPTATDSVFLEGNTITVTISGTQECLDFTISGTSISIASAATPTLNVYGSFLLHSSTIWGSTIPINFAATTTGKTITTNGVTCNSAEINFTGVGGEWSLGSAFTSYNQGNVRFSAGTFNLNGFNVTAGVVVSSSTTTRAINFGDNRIYLVHPTALTAVLALVITTNMTFTGTGGFSASMTTTRVFQSGTTAGGSLTTAPNLFITGGSSAPTFTNGSWWNILDFTGSSPANTGATIQNIVTKVIMPLGASNLTSPTWSFRGNNSTITSNGQVLRGNVQFNTGEGNKFLCTESYTWGNFALGSMNITLVSGNLDLNGFDQTATGLQASGTTVRSIAFGANYWIIDVGTGSPVVSCATATNFSCTGTGGIAFKNQGSPTYTWGTTGGNTTNCPNLFRTGFGSVGNTLTVTANSWCLDFNDGTSVPALATGPLNIARNCTLSSTVTYGNFFVSKGPGTWNGTASRPGLTIDHAGTTILSGGWGTLVIQSGGTVQFNPANLPLLNNITLTQGTLDITDIYLQCSTLISDNSNVRSILFGTTGALEFSNVGLTTSLNMATATNFTYTGTSQLVGCTSTTAGETKTYNFGTTAGATASNVMNVRFNGTRGSNASTVTTVLTGGGSFKNVNFTGTSTSPGGVGFFVYGDLILGNGTPQSNFSPTMVGTGNLNTNAKALGGLTINCPGGTTTLTNNVTLVLATSGITFTQGTLTLNGYTMTCGVFTSDNSNTRTINFGSTNIILANTSAATVNLTMTNILGLTCTGTGGFQATANVTRTFSCGNFFGTVANAPNIYILAGTSIQSFSTDSCFKIFSMLGTGTTPTCRINMSSIVFPATGTFTGISATIRATGTVNTNGRTLSIFNVNMINPTDVCTLQASVLTSTTLTSSLSQGTLALNGFSLSCGVFSSTTATQRRIEFGSGTINLTNINNGTVNLLMTDMTNFTCSATTGGFAATPAVTRTYQIGNTSGGTNSNSPNLTFTSTGTNTQTIATGSWVNKLDFGATAVSTSNVILNLNTLVNTNASTTAMTFNFVGTGTISTNGRPVFNVNFNNPGGTTTFLGAVTQNIQAQTCTLTAGTVNLNGFNLSIGLFSSNNSNVRQIDFGTGTIFLGGSAGQTVLDMANTTNFTCTGTGGFSTTGTNAKTFNVGTTGGSVTGAPNLSITSGAAIPTLTSGSWFKVLTFTGTTSTPATTIINVDTLTLATGGTYTGLSPIFTRTQTWTPQFSKQLNGIGVGATGVTLTLEATQTYTAGSTLYVNAGTINLNSLSLTFGSFNSSGTGSRSITSNGSITINNDWTVTTGSGFTGSDYTINMAKATAKTFAGGGGIYGNLVQAGAGALTISGSNQFNNITATTQPSTISFTAGTTQTLTNFTLSGTAGNLVTINSVTSGTQFNLLRTSGTVNVNYLTISDSNARSAFFSNLTSVNSGNNTGWNFTFPAVVQSGFASFF